MTRATRRGFLQTAALAGWGTWTWQHPHWTRGESPNEKLNVAIVGTGGRGRGNLNGVARTENIVALCDVDERRLGPAAEAHPHAKTYADYRKMLEQADIDAVQVNTPDHTHAAISIAAMELGKHVYCEKPLASSVGEARAMAQSAARNGVVTQMGNQLHALDSLRRIVEVLQADVLGPVQRVVTFCNKVLRHSGSQLPTDTPPVPDYLDWDLWLGPAPERPYHPNYHPGGWRVFWGLGSGNFADMACHILDAPYWGLGLRYPSTIEAEGPPADPHVAPQEMVVRYQFARANAEPLEVAWYDGRRSPPDYPVQGAELPGEGVLIDGQRGQLLFDFRNRSFRLLPEDVFADVTLPEPTLPRPTDHYHEWTEACKGRGETASDFDYGAAITETVLAGVVAYRAGQRLEWDGPAMQAKNCPEAEPLIHPPQREGWYPLG